MALRLLPKGAFEQDKRRNEVTCFRTKHVIAVKFCQMIVDMTIWTLLEIVNFESRWKSHLDWWSLLSLRGNVQGAIMTHKLGGIGISRLTVVCSV